MYPFFKCDRLSNFVTYWGLFVSVLCIMFIKPVTMGIVGKEAYAGFKFRTLLMGLEIAIIFGYSVVVFMENNKFKLSKKDGLSFINILPMLLFSMMPYVPMGLFGEGNPLIELEGFTQWHRIFLYFNFIVPICIHFVLRKQSFRARKFMLLYLSLAALLVFLSAHRFADWVDPESWPLHLCHTAMFIVPLCLIFKLDKL